MNFLHAEIYQGTSGFLPGGFSVEAGRFTRIFPESASPADGIDLAGARVIPGLVDLHLHGCLNSDTSDGDPEALIRMAAALADRGITSFLPTTMTLPYDRLRKVLSSVQEVLRRDPPGTSRILGLHMEGPYLSPSRCGSQNPAWLRDPDTEGFLSLQASSGDLIRIVTIAPELPGSMEFIRRVKGSAVVSLAHTDADYDTAVSAFGSGASHVTHLFNAMRPLLHREPGVIGAAADRSDVTVELISDGFHIHPSVVRSAFRLFPHRICLISDSLRCLGMPDGTYELGGQEIRLRHGEARLPDGTIAGSVTDLYDGMRNAIAYGIPAADAVEAATATPARRIGMAQEIGSIAPGLSADFVICDKNWNRLAVYLRGIQVNG
ncbi:MAG: N-acetylglucosamine-6-phosphate deacetylase [Lachnospiraceae bacterium]|nr:N-acetylglucosamine-6-phosphate deacetylase [Lachnospiraceae bacterium]